MIHNHYIEKQNNHGADTRSRPHNDRKVSSRGWHPHASLGEMLTAVAKAGENGNRNVDPRLQTRATGMSESVPSDGGFLIRPDFTSDLMSKTYLTSEAAKRCFLIPISKGGTVYVPGVSESSRADGSRWGGIQAYWTDEGASNTASKPKLRKLQASANKLTGLLYVTDELLEDAPALETIIKRAFAEEFAFKLDDALFNGDGSGKPLGVLNSGALVTVAKEVGQGADTVVNSNISKMWARCWGPSRRNAVWFINQDADVELNNLSLTISSGGGPAYLPANAHPEQEFPSLYGRPVIPVEPCQTVGTVGDIVLADFGEYLLAEKGGIQGVVSVHVKFVEDETAFRFVLRVDGQPAWSEPLTPFKGTDTLSPFVALADRD